MNKSLIALAAIGLSLTVTVAEAALIDNFAVPQEIFDNNVGGTPPSNLSGPLGSSSVFASRRFTVNKTAPIIGRSRANLRSDSGLLTFESGPNVRGSGTVLWTSPSGVDLLTGANKFQFGNYFADQLFSLSMVLTDSNNNTLTYTNGSMPLGDGSGVFNIPYLDLAGTGDLSDITSLSLVFSDLPSGSASPDVGFTFLRTIPEPGAIGLIGLGALAYAAFARRKSQAV